MVNVVAWLRTAHGPVTDMRVVPKALLSLLAPLHCLCWFRSTPLLPAILEHNCVARATL